MPDKSENLPPDFDRMLAKICQRLAKSRDTLVALRVKIEDIVALSERAKEASGDVKVISESAKLVGEGLKAAAVSAKAVADGLTMAASQKLDRATSRADKALPEISKSLGDQYELIKELSEITAMMVAWRANGYKSEDMSDTDTETDADDESEDDGNDSEGE